MNRFKCNTILFFFASIILHGAILIAAMIYLAVDRPLRSGNLAPLTVNSYFAQEGSLTHTQFPTNQAVKARASENRLPVMTHKTIKPLLARQSLKQRPASHPAMTKSNLPKSNKEGPLPSALLMLLHTAIQQHQRYPLSAEQREEQGTATVNFTLLKDGTVQHLRIVKSSGATSLDKAALAAVYEAQPFKGIDNYLEFAEDFSIEVSFDLSSDSAE